MKNFIFVLLLIATTAEIYSQTEPGIKWRAIDWAARESTTGLPQTQAESGEDWWYDHENVFNAAGTHTGYIAAGFAQGLNRTDDYEIDEGGCYSCTVAGTLAEPGRPVCGRFENQNRISNCTRHMLFEYETGMVI